MFKVHVKTVPPPPIPKGWGLEHPSPDLRLLLFPVKIRPQVLHNTHLQGE